RPLHRSQSESRADFDLSCLCLPHLLLLALGAWIPTVWSRPRASNCTGWATIIKVRRQHYGYLLGSDLRVGTVDLERGYTKLRSLLEAWFYWLCARRRFGVMKRLSLGERVDGRTARRNRETGLHKGLLRGLSGSKSRMRADTHAGREHQ